MLYLSVNIGILKYICVRKTYNQKMEFDNTMNLRPVTEVFAASHETLDEFCEKLFDILSSDGHVVGNAGGGEFWVDYSDTFTTRHLVVNVTEADGGFNVRFRSGKRFGHVGDVAVMAMVLLAFYCVGRMFVPGPSFLNISGLCISAVIISMLLTAYGRKFGTLESGNIINRLVK